MPANSFSARLKLSFFAMACATLVGRWQDSRSGRVARNTPSGESNRRSTRADRREARPGVSPSASQEREASSCIGGEPTRRVIELSSSSQRKAGSHSCVCNEESRLARRLRRVFLQNGIQRLDEKIRIGFGKNQRRAQLDDVVVRAVGSVENAAIAQAINHVSGLQRSGLSRFTVEHEVYPQEQTRAAHVTDQSMPRLQGLQALDQMRTDAQSML